MRILFYIRKNQNAKSATIQTRVTVGGVRANPYSTGIVTLVTEWDAKIQKIVTKDKGRKELVEEHNKALKNIETALNKTYNALQENSSVPVISPQRVIEDTYQPKKTKKTFLELVEPCFTYLHARHQHASGTIKNYNIRKNNIKLFLESEKIDNCYCEEITPAIIGRFSVWLRTQKNSGNSHINKGMEAFQQVVKWAKMNGYSEKNEISDVEKEKVTKKEIIYVEMEDILEIYHKDIPDAAWRKIVDVFTFQCYTSLDYCDVKRLKESDIYLGMNGDKRITIIRKKSTKDKPLVQDFRFLPIAQEIWERYEGKLPLLTLEKYNKYLQVIYPFYGISVHVTSKIGRKLAATEWVDSEIPLDVASGMLGHKKIQTTMDYYVKTKKKRAEKEQEKLK